MIFQTWFCVLWHLVCFLLCVWNNGGKMFPQPFSIEDLCTAPMVSWESQTLPSFSPPGPSEQIVETSLHLLARVTSSVSIGQLWCLLLCLLGRAPAGVRGEVKKTGFAYLFNKAAWMSFLNVLQGAAARDELHVFCFFFFFAVRSSVVLTCRTVWASYLLSEAQAEVRVNTFIWRTLRPQGCRQSRGGWVGGAGLSEAVIGQSVDELDLCGLLIFQTSCAGNISRPVLVYL